MKILFHGWEFPPQGAGVGAYMFNMAKSLGQCGHQAIVVTGKVDGLPDEEETEFGTVYRAYNKAQMGHRDVRDLVLSIAAKHHVNLIEGADHLGECAEILKCARQFPVLIKIHSCQVVKVLRNANIFYPWQQITTALARLRARKQMRSELYSITHADLACVPSQRLYEELNKQKISLPDKFRVIPNPIITQFSPVEREAPHPVLLFVGRIEYLKGIEFLPAIMSRIVSMQPDVRLEIAGPDSYARFVGSLKSWLSGRLGGLMDHTRFLGPLNIPDLTEAYRRAWVVICPSKWDNFPNVVLESMVHGKPVVATPHGGMPEMLANTGCPIAEPDTEQYSDAVLNLLQDKTLRWKIGQAMYERVKTCYGPEAIVPQYINFIKSAI